LRVLTITRGAPPLDEVISVGSAIRAYNYLSFLKRSGADCYFLSGSNEISGIKSEIEGIKILSFSSDLEIPKIIEALQPDLIIVCVSELMQYIPEKIDACVILDLFAHRFTESLFENVDLSTDMFLRLDMLRKADYFIVNSSRQRDFVYSILILAGLEDIINRVLIIPHIVLNRPLERKIPDEPVFVAGGFRWPWADDRSYINLLSQILEKNNRGKIRIYGGRFALESRIRDTDYGYNSSPRIEQMGLLPYVALLSEYSKASAGILCFEENIERYFSFSFRSVDYLFSGLPVVINDFIQLSELIKKYDAGWVVKNPAQFNEVIERIISDNELILHKSDNVTTLVMQEFDLNKCMEPLFNIIKNNSKIHKRDGLVSGLIRIVDRYVKEGIEHSNYVREVKNLEAENIRLSERIVAKDLEILHLNNEKTEILRESGWLKDEIKRANDELTRLKDEIMRVRSEKERFEKEVIDLNARLTELMRKNGYLEDEKIRAGNEIASIKDEIFRLKDEIVEHKKSITILESEIQKRDQIIADLKKKEAELEGMKSLPMYKIYKKIF